MPDALLLLAASRRHVPTGLGGLVGGLDRRSHLHPAEMAFFKAKIRDAHVKTPLRVLFFVFFRQIRSIFSQRPYKAVKFF